MRRAPFARLIRAEFRKLTGTLADRILVVAGPVVLAGFLLLFCSSIGSDVSAAGQVDPLALGLRTAPLVVQALLVKLIAGEWHYRSAQPTLLVQPARGRYLTAQLVVALPVWLLCAAGSAAIYFPAMSATLAADDVEFLGSYRVGWIIMICVLGGFLMTLSALTVAILIPNAPGALAGYLVLIQVLGALSGLLPVVGAWIDPLTPMLVVAEQLEFAPLPAAIVSAVLWTGLFVLAVTRYLRRDAA